MSHQNSSQETQTPYETPKHEHQYGKLIVFGQVSCLIFIVLLLLDAATGMFGGIFVEGFKDIASGAAAVDRS